MKCLLLFAALLLCLVSLQVKEARAYFLCQSGVPYIENGCNLCYCPVTAGGLICGQRTCPSHFNPRWTRCRLGTSWLSDCNRCWCEPYVGTICTAYRCPYSLYG